MEIPKIKGEIPQEEVFSPESNKDALGTLDLVDKFFRLDKKHESPKDSISRVMSAYDLSINEIKDTAAKAMEDLLALDAKEAVIIKAAKETGEQYKQALQELQKNI